MNDNKRNKIKLALTLSARMRQSLSLLDGFEETTVKKNLDCCISLCERICKVIKELLSDEVNSHESVPLNLRTAENTIEMRTSIRQLNNALKGYSSMISSYNSLIDKYGIEHWPMREEIVAKLESDIDEYEESLKDATGYAWAS